MALQRKRIVLLSGISVVIVLCVFAAVSWGDDVMQIFSNQPDDNIGAWYDEAYEASGFYRLLNGSAGNYGYVYTTEPANNSNPANYKPLPCDVVVTEWKVSGHVHFSSGM